MKIFQENKQKWEPKTSVAYPTLITVTKEQQSMTFLNSEKIIFQTVPRKFLPTQLPTRIPKINSRKIVTRSRGDFPIFDEITEKPVRQHHFKVKETGRNQCKSPK